MAVLVAYAFVDCIGADHPSNRDISSLERWNTHQNQKMRIGGLSLSLGTDESREFSYQDGPYPLTNDDGLSMRGRLENRPCEWPWDCYVSDSMYWFQLGDFSAGPMKAAGNFVVGNDHESYIGDKNGNGVLEWVVLYAYIPWMFDGLDNDGDGCIDEKKYDHRGQTGCDNMIDAAVVYETGGQPIVGGEKGDLMLNLDWYSVVPSVEIYRATVSPPFGAFRIRGFFQNPHIAGEFVSYQAGEAENMVNSNPEMDSDLDDFYVGNIDARLFPLRPPSNNICSAGLMTNEISPTWKREDGSVITAYELVESFDGRDWNGDGDIADSVVAYYAVDPNTGNCRVGVNTAVQGHSPMTSGEIVTPEYTYESSDRRDWNLDGDGYDSVQLYHDVNSTWSLRGIVYRSSTYHHTLIIRQEYGFGWWALIKTDWRNPVFPFEFGGAYAKYKEWSWYFESFFFLISDEDGNRHTKLPEHKIVVGTTMGVVGNRCVLVSATEYDMDRAGIVLMGNDADANGDGDLSDSISLIFCPDRTGGNGRYIIEPSGMYAQGLYADDIPALWEGMTEYGVFPIVDGNATIPSYSYSICKLEDNFFPHPHLPYSNKVDQYYQVRFP